MTKPETLPLELRKLGLTEKEVRVYLAALELGHTSAQIIAQKAQISRPTSYEVIKSLESKGLIAESKEKGKRYFTAQSPDHLLGIIRRQKRELDEKERELFRIIAVLRDKYYSSDQREIRTYSGKTGLEILLDDFLTTNAREICLLAADDKIWPSCQREKAYQKIKKRLGRIQIKEISNQKDKSPFPYLERKSLRQNYPFKGILLIYDKVIVISSLKDGLLIKNKTVVDLIKSFFLTIWQSN